MAAPFLNVSATLARSGKVGQYSLSCYVRKFGAVFSRRSVSSLLESACTDRLPFIGTLAKKLCRFLDAADFTK
jgi:hypothetical protein